MTVWACYTEYLSEPTFWGYVNTKREALSWIKNFIKTEHSDKDMGFDIQNDRIQASDVGEHYVIAVKLEKIA